MTDITKAGPATDNLIYTEKDVADMLKISVRTLRHWRYRGKDLGPRYYKAGRAVRYMGNDINQWLSARTHACTIEYEMEGH